MQAFASVVNVNNKKKKLLTFQPANIFCLVFAPRSNSSAADGCDGSEQQWCERDTLVGM